MKDFEAAAVGYVEGLRAQRSTGNWHRQKKADDQFDAVHALTRKVDQNLAYRLYVAYYCDQKAEGKR